MEVRPGWSTRRRVGARRVGAVVVAVLAASLLAACGSSGASSSSSSPTTSAVSSTAATTSAAAAEVKQAWESFFAGTTSAQQKQALLENGSQFAQLLAAQATSPTAKATTAQVSKVTLVGADQAKVVYSVVLDGKPALTDQNGTATLVDGTWKVSVSSFCQLLALEGTPPPLCTKAVSTPAQT